MRAYDRKCQELVPNINNLMHLCFFQQKIEEPHGLDSARRELIGERGFVSFKEVFGSVESGSNETRDRAEEELEDGSVARGEVVEGMVGYGRKKVEVSD
ncbi:3,9-dihydroxypterocarpan 6A-monooxygenase [Senna tora]|uniref:3,9-dihydroxypterocarpan 6A-monooxygenase n=1 Tax=Senna tora TaxID=362788 RepID=A0A834XB96_9FABA|nr:3,9-dihydroxypterocarpan 6A-monooxygenase [Senna tora]